MRENAVRILGLYGPHAKSARPALLAFAVKHRREGDTDKVLRAYMSIGPAEEDIQDLASFLGEDESHAEEASAALAQIGMPAIPSLVKGLKIKGSRRYCAKALGFIGPPASNAAPALVEILESGGYEDAAQALGKIGKASVVPLCKSMKSMGHTETHKRIWAARAYIHVCKRGDAIPPQLDQLMGDMYPNVKSWAAAAVLKSDPGQAKALSILRANLTHCDPNCRVEAACALLIAGDAAVPLLPEIIAALADTKSPSARILAMVVGMHADKAGKAIPTLAKGLANLDLTRSHAEALARFGPKAWRALPDLIRAMAKMGDWPNGKYIAKAIQNIRG
jgi:HEAT repeat protein